MDLLSSRNQMIIVFKNYEFETLFKSEFDPALTWLCKYFFHFLYRPQIKGKLNITKQTLSKQLINEEFLSI